MEDLNKIVFEEDNFEIEDIEDSGCALITTISGDDPNMFVRIQSWDEDNQIDGKEYEHKRMRHLVGKKVRVTIEVVE